MREQYPQFTDQPYGSIYLSCLFGDAAACAYTAVGCAPMYYQFSTWNSPGHELCQAAGYGRVARNDEGRTTDSFSTDGFVHPGDDHLVFTFSPPTSFNLLGAKVYNHYYTKLLCERATPLVLEVR